MSISLSPSDPVAVLGATGAQGGAVVRALLAAGLPVRAIARSPEKLAGLAAAHASPGGSGPSDASLETRAADVTDRAALARALDGAGAAFAHVPLTSGVWGPAVGEVGRAVAGALADARVPFTVYSTSGPGTRPGAGSTSPHFDGMGAAEQAVLGAGVPALVLRPAGYLDNLSAPFSAPAVLGGAVVYPLPAGFRYRWVSHADQAALVAAALAAVRSRPGAAADLAGRSFAIGHLLDGDALAAEVARGLGQPVHYRGITPAEFAATLAPVLGPMAEPIADDYRVIVERADALGVADDTAAGLDALGVALTPVADWARVQDWSGAAAALGVAAAP